MKTMLAGVLLWLGASMCLFDCISANYEKTCTTEDLYQQPRGLCGPKLSNLLAIICRGDYNKRSHDHSFASAYLPLTRDLMDGGSKIVSADDLRVPSDQSRLARQNVFLPKSAALAFLHDKRNGYMNDGSTSQGIICECCINQCTMTELREYCAQSPK